MKLSTRALNIQPSSTIMMNLRARTLKEAGRDVIDLSVGEPDFATPEPVRNAAIAAIEAGNNHYTPVAGYSDARQAVRRKFLAENALDYPLESVMLSCGAKHCIANALLCLAEPGDKVAIPAPHWVSYSELSRLAGATPVSIATHAQDNYKLSPEKLRAVLEGKPEEDSAQNRFGSNVPRAEHEARQSKEPVRVLIICNPSNPTGLVYSRDELAALAKVLVDFPEVTIISDEVYEHINYVGGHTSIAQFEGLKDRTVVVNGVSKAYAMTGWRIGFLAAQPGLVKACIDLQGQMITHASSIAQRAALAALEGGASLYAPMVATFKERRDLAFSKICQFPKVRCCKPEGAFYLFPDLSAYLGLKAPDSGAVISGTKDLCEYFLEKALVATVPGDAFAQPGSVRISFASASSQIERALDRLGEALAALTQ